MLSAQLNIPHTALCRHWCLSCVAYKQAMKNQTLPVYHNKLGFLH